MAKLWRKPLDHLEKPPAVSHVLIDKQRCKGCGYCVEFCPRKALQMSTELNPKGYLLAAVVDEDKCLACGFCEVICPEFAIKVFQDNKSSE